MNPKRRGFLKQSFRYSLTASFWAFAASCTSAVFVKGTKEGEEIRVPLEGFPQEGPLVVHHPALFRPVGISKAQTTGFRAVSMMCTHKGCEIEPAGSRFQCPCHGSAFSLSGEVLSPPAQKKLFALPLRVEENALYISLRTQPRGRDL